ncbi:PAS domain-containing sensor histidine kinase [Sphingosinicella sp. BN140058]|uniref:hybrid sensor histidine kinase/response regulator n=1 Tax=Sphingosinicella sp. BN140058 TaxID=1892855 RepID=UPI0010132181|nr:PAS domain-containing sensor histidine kinase [Sphingosinicella sp. BN140058]QAY75393.1 PAS domain-containing sensor histidine kinase [Sphingosinicella sp. BN140058]
MAEAARFESHLTEQRFRLLVNAVTDYALYMLDADGHVATWNPGARRFKGYEADEIIGRHFSNFFTEEDRAAGLPERVLGTAVREGKFEAEGWRVRKDGTRFWAHVVVDPIRDDHGTLVGFAKITRDISEKKAADDALRQSERRFRMLVQGVRDYAIYMLDPEGHVTNWNSGAEEIKGYKADEIVGKHFSQFYTEEDRANGEPVRALATALREGKYEKEAWRLRKDGSRFMASVVIDPIFDDDGQHIGFAKVTRDVTERHRAQLELEETRAALQQSQKLQALGELTGGIAHDFNNLMTVIRGSADLLRRGTLSDEKRVRYLDAITETADRAAMLTSHLLAFGRRQALKPEVIDLNVRLDAFGEVLSRTLGGSIQVQLDLAPSLWPVEVDSTQLETALLNAAFNARDAMPNGGAIILATCNRADQDGDWVSITLHDTGEGMSEEVLGRVFEPFFTTKPVGKGTGLGLSQIHGFAAQSGGRAEIESTLGEGTTIRLLLPRSGKTGTPAEATPQALQTERQLNVLLVEDNDHVREFATALVEDLGHKVVPADGGEAALALLDREPIDLLFTDVVMPGMSGVELARRARERRRGMPVLLASGYSDEILAGAGAEFHFVHKPYDAQQLGLALMAAYDEVPTLN